MKDGLTIAADGGKSWHLNGLLHREGGPAIETAGGSKHWYQNGVLHRVDGPAIEYDTLEFWYLNGEHIECETQEKFLRIIKLKAFL